MTVSKLDGVGLAAALVMYFFIKQYFEGEIYKLVDC